MSLRSILTPTLTLALLLPGALLAQSSAAPKAVTVDVSGLHSAKGQIVACLWKDKDGFPSCEKSRTAVKLIVPVTATMVRLRLPIPEAGDYAVTVLHDEDGNGRVKHNFIGMPTEGVGISNNPGGMPGYAKSLVPLKPGGEIAIRMRYLFG